MRIALIGYGKMGKAIEEVAVKRGHEIVLKIDENNLGDFTESNVSKADVAIEFTGPHSAYDNVSKLIGWGIPVVCGSTGWLENVDEVNKLCEEKKGSFLYASNFSIGVNIFFEVNKKLASMMATHNDYTVSIEEIHHTQKKDAPSGTAITLAEQILESYPGKEGWVNKKSEDPTELSIVSKRIDPAPGTHTIKYSSDIDDIEITHTAHNRVGFAAGAVLGAEYVHERQGVFTMKDVLGFTSV
ncbi:MAG: 4-hydroxy-tetrahydrodipicolinate reductase [Chitinophagaceae bacterium]|nr:4-hydroxy-tetrahydrodipicolinate reductase [Chitinophagaceae bacterium]